MTKLIDPIIDKMQLVLQARGRRHANIASNLANADTVGFRARRFDFEDQLASAEKRGELSALGPKKTEIGSIRTDLDAPLNPDGNSVTRETEITRMAENQLLYRATAKAVSRQLALLRYAIGEGGR